MARLRSALNKQSSDAISLPAPKETKRTVLKEKTNTTLGEKNQSAGAGKHGKAGVKNARAQRKPPSDRISTTQEASVVERLLQNAREAPGHGEDEAVEALVDGASDRPASRESRRPTRSAKTSVQTTAQSKVLAGLKQRMDATARGLAQTSKERQIAADEITSFSDTPKSQHGATPQPTMDVPDLTELSLSPSPPANNLNSAHGKRTSLIPPGSAIRVQGTPAHEMSILALKNFRRRPRQPSMLQMIQNRTTSARPSLANTQANEDSSVFDLEADEDADDFLPEAEGTPLQVGNVKQGSSRRLTDRIASMGGTAGETASPITHKKRKPRDVEHLDNSSSLAKLKRSRKSNHPRNDEKPLVESSPRGRLSLQESLSRASNSVDVQVLGSEPSSTPVIRPSSTERRPSSTQAEFIVPSTEQQEANEHIDRLVDVRDPYDVISAEPASSPLQSPSLPPTTTQATDIFAEPLTQRSPPPKKRATMKAQRPLEPLPTDALKSLLPRRRRPLPTPNRKSHYDIGSGDESDSLDLDDDEDDFSLTMKKSNSARPAKKQQSVVTAPTKQKKTRRQAKTSVSAVTSKKPSRVYGRKTTTSDKENEGKAGQDEDDPALPEASHATQTSRSKELDEVRRKFAEVDEWDLSFEAITPEDHRSSSQGWR